METTQGFAIDPDDPPTFEKVWKMFRETREQIAATDRQMKETDRRVGELTNRFGDMVEHMVVPNLLEKFKTLGFVFEMASRDLKITDQKNNIFVEVDVFLQNGDKVMIVEIKATPSVKDITNHVKRMEKMRRYADLTGTPGNTWGLLPELS
ncbi:MAG: hypothetical protein LBG07_09685 [Treponema sp.]|jgi:hypothetical protein|nr:hypothetical protein [Treponema sp.]